MDGLSTWKMIPSNIVRASTVLVQRACINYDVNVAKLFFCLDLMIN